MLDTFQVDRTLLNSIGLLLWLDLQDNWPCLQCSMQKESWHNHRLKEMTNLRNDLLVPPGLLMGKVFEAYLTLGQCHSTKCLGPKKLVPNE